MVFISNPLGTDAATIVLKFRTLAEARGHRDADINQVN